MSKVLTHGPTNTDVPAITTCTFVVTPLHFEADFRLIDSGPGKSVYTDITAPTDQPSTIRIAQTSRANVYAGTSIDPSVYLPSRRGTDTILECREIWVETDSTDTTYRKEIPVRCAITMTLPDTSAFADEDVEALVARTVALLFAQGEDTADGGINAILRGVTGK